MKPLGEINETVEILQADTEKYDKEGCDKVREIEHADYIATHKEYTAPTDAQYKNTQRRGVDMIALV